MVAKTPVAMIHCALGRASNWRPMLNAMDQSVSPLLIELPGHGLAEPYESSRDYTDQAVEIALDEMPSTPVPLVGHSYGAAVALRIAVERPYRVSSVVLIEPVFFAAVKGRWAYEKVQRDLATFAKKLASGEHAVAAREFHKVWGDGDWDALNSEQRAYMVDRIPLVAAGNSLLFDDRTGILAPDRMEEVDVPVTFIDGGATHPVISEIIGTIGDRFQNADWVSIPDAGHMLPMTHPELAVKAMEGRLFVEPTH